MENKVENYFNVMARPQLWGMSPYPAATCGVACFLTGIKGFKKSTSVKEAAISLNTSKGLPTRGALFGIGSGLLASAYVLSLLDDEVNGASMATAWGTLYSGVFLVSSIKSKNPVAIALGTLISFSTYFYGKETISNYF